jgi:phage shock protein PspC (stress-responsive transcriptional regulator)
MAMPEDGCDQLLEREQTMSDHSNEAGPEEAPWGAGRATGAEEPHGRPLLRRREGRVLAGVAGGLGDYLGVDPVLMRVGFAGLTLLGGLGLLLYLVAWVLLPDTAGGSAPAEGFLRQFAAAPVGIRVALLVLAALVALGVAGEFSGTAVILLLFAAAIVLVRGSRAYPQG